MITLDEKYVIEADDACYALKVKTIAKKKDGEEKEPSYRPRGYYTSLYAAICAWYDELNREVVKNRSMTLAEAINAISDNREKVCKAVRAALPNIEIKSGYRGGSIWSK